ncbi:hypothetical protein RAZWK3B_15498 [Roseobacter sp. AzwK-3b]|uniref:hypothetical protein n=1 Tax=Roseobacter sp. AzwK-3b TaxID=351016 RepID=UPI000156A4E0|nr:hypothetical protein [Roseobacter sp. AzwK-3b]EDM70815.1 hypothetical protein RAZWK3B_15498 [Roseobacter sp. AzwK-3b]
MSILARIRANGGDVIRDEWRMTLRPGRLKPEAIAWLQQPRIRAALHEEVWPLAPEWEERAAIREYCGGQRRAEAEPAAYREVIARC